jgi:hypothetical protein
MHAHAFLNFPLASSRSAPLPRSSLAWGQLGVELQVPRPAEAKAPLPAPGIVPRAREAADGSGQRGGGATTAGAASREEGRFRGPPGLLVFYFGARLCLGGPST